MKLVHVSITALVALSMTGSAFADTDRVSAAKAKLQAARQGRAPVVTGPALCTGSSTETFNIGAFAKGLGGGKRDNMGKATLVCKATAPTRFEVTMDGKAAYKSKDRMKDIQFDVSRTFEISGTTVRKVAESKNTFNGDAKKYEQKILNMLALAHLVKFRAPGAKDDEVTYIVEGNRYAVRYVTVGGGVEATLRDAANNRQLAKFFLTPNGSGPSALREFRVQTKGDKVNINFKKG